MKNIYTGPVNIFLVTMVFLSSCNSTRSRAISDLKHLGYQRDSRFQNSVLAFTARPATDGFMFAYGTGFVVAEDVTRYIGITNQHVWQQCQSIRTSGDCLIAFSNDPQESNYQHALAKPFNGLSGKHLIGYNKDWRSGQYLDYAFFVIEKSPELYLRKMLLDIREPSTNPQLVTVAGFPGGTVRQGEEFVRSSLVTSSGFGFAAGSTSGDVISFNGGKPEDLPDTIVLTSHLRGGNSGSPVLTMRDDAWVVIGIASEGVPYESRTVTINSNRSASKDSYARWGRAVSLNSIYSANKVEIDWSKFEFVGDIAESVTDLSKNIISTGYSKQIIDGEVNFNFKVEFSNDIETEYLYINGISFKFADAMYKNRTLKVKVSQDELTSFNYPDLVIEYMKPQSSSLAMCYKNNFSDQVKILKCFPRLSYEVRYLDSKSVSAR